MSTIKQWILKGLHGTIFKSVGFMLITNYLNVCSQNPVPQTCRYLLCSYPWIRGLRSWKPCWWRQGQELPCPWRQCPGWKRTWRSETWWRGSRTSVGERAKGGKGREAGNWCIYSKISNGAGVVGQGLDVRDGRVWALPFKWLPSIPQKPEQKNKWIPYYIHEIIVKGLPAVEQLLLYPFHLGCSYLLEYSCAGMAGSCWPPLTSALTFIPWQGEYRGARRTIETRRHQSLPVPKPQGHRIAQKALPALPVSTLLSMESPDNSTFLF